MTNFFREIHRRSLWQVLGIYAAGSWVILQIVDTLAGALNLPDWADSLALFILIVGLPIVLATAFIQGAPATSEAEPDAGPSDAAPSDEPAPDDQHQGGEGAPIPTGAASFFTWRNSAAGGVVALAVWGLGALGWALWGPDSPEGAVTSDSSTSPTSPSGALLPQGDNRRKSIAVLPFENQSPDADNAFLADGIHESVLTQLSGIGELRVLSHASMMRYRDSELTLREIADEVGAGTILRGSVRRAGDVIRVSAQLIDPNTDENLWAQQIDGAADEIFEMESQVALQVAGALEATLGPRQMETLSRPQTESVEALDFFNRGRRAYARRRDADNEEAIRLFRLAIKADSGFAGAWAKLGGGYLQKNQIFGYPRSWLDSAEVVVRRSLALDSTLADAHVAMGSVSFLRGRNRESIEWFTGALELNPNSVEAAASIGVANIFIGDWAGALRSAKLAYRLDPASPAIRELLANAYQDLREFDIAQRWLDEALLRDPGSPQVRRQQQALSIQRGESDVGYRTFREYMEASGEADNYVQTVAVNGAHYAREVDDVLELTGPLLASAEGATRGASYHDVRVIRAFALSQLGGLDGEALELLASAEQEYSIPMQFGADSWLFPLMLGAVHMVRGSHAEGLDWLQTAVEGGFAGWHLLQQDPIYDAVREEPRYRELVATMRGRLEAHREAIEAEELAAGER